MKLPPLVEPIAELSKAAVQRYSRHLLIPEIAVTGQQRLASAKVLVVGAGGLGSPALTYLAAAGVGTLGVIDDDVVEMSNLQRQVIHSPADLGRAKTASAAAAIARINPMVTVVTHQLRITAANAVELISGYDLVLDGTDNFATRYLLNDACVLTGRPYVWGSILRFEGQVSVFWALHGPTYRDIYPQPPPPGTVPSCAEAGVLGLLCATIGSIMGTEAVKLICGIGEPLVGRVLMYDALDMTFRTVQLRADPRQSPITAVPQDAALNSAADHREPDPSVELGPADLKALLDSGSAVTMIDVREPPERAIARIDGDRGIPLQRIIAGDAVGDLPRDTPIVLYCKSGARSAQALSVLQHAGFPNARVLRGGILAWIDEIEPWLSRY